MKLSRDEESFLRHWIYDEAHYNSGNRGPAKILQIEHGVIPADLAAIIAAAIPDPVDQAAAASNMPPGLPTWPWTDRNFQERLNEARQALGQHAPVHPRA